MKQVGTRARGACVCAPLCAHTPRRARTAPAPRAAFQVAELEGNARAQAYAMGVRAAAAAVVQGVPGADWGDVWHAVSGQDDQTTEEEEPARICAICKGGMGGAAGGTRWLRCGHEFHASCVITALQFKAQCPLCRRPACACAASMAGAGAAGTCPECAVQLG